MNTVFKVGDICIGKNFVTRTHRNGMECEIVGGLDLRGTEMSYLVRWADGELWPQFGRNLTLKRHPGRWRDEKVSWESVGWMPEEVKLDRAIKQALKDKMRERA